ncbi:MAG: right-handed parallel beta-helix repeat-containing protein [Vallitaleaceae bacterium]|nr:right-handed parallel beta-helix repeat-containing protein [Vallitaleaceae bacterium]
MRDETLRLPKGNDFFIWEEDVHYNIELHVDQGHQMADDKNEGTKESPLKTIQEAANRALPGTKVLIHQGIYRECVSPLHGGESPSKMISYEAYEEEEVVIKASEVIDQFNLSEGWNLESPYQPSGKDLSKMQIWSIQIDPEMFKGYNPFCCVNILHDRLFIEYAKTDMTTYLNRRGMIFCDNKPMQQVALYQQMAELPGSFWVEANGMTLHFRLEQDDEPSQHCIEVTCREQCFAPKIPFLSYIKMRGLTCSHAATGAPVPQRGAISCYRGHHWIIEDCTVDWSNGVGIDIGNECWHHTRIDQQVLGYTIIRRCKIFNVGVCAIAAMFAHHLLLEDNLIQGTGWQKMELSWEAGGFKAHGCTDSLFRRNIFTKTIRADHLWLDMFNENNRITQNLFLDGIEQREAIFIECSRDGINLIDNNIFWRVEGRFDSKQVLEESGSAGWYKTEEDSIVNGYAVYSEGSDHIHMAHNFFGKCRSAGYFAKTVSFRIVGNTRGGTSRDAKLYNNIFYECGEAAIKMPTRNNYSEGNLFLNMPGGYLRIMYPAPTECLDLQAWQEFYGFDCEGQEGRIEVEIDTENYTFAVTKAKNELPSFRRMHPIGDYVSEIQNIKKVKANEMIVTDFYGALVEEQVRLPGPIHDLEEKKVFSIDPRKLYRK